MEIFKYVYIIVSTFIKHALDPAIHKVSFFVNFRVENILLLLIKFAVDEYF